MTAMLSAASENPQSRATSGRQPPVVWTARPDTRAAQAGTLRGQEPALAGNTDRSSRPTLKTAAGLVRPIVAVTRQENHVKA